ncbi:hypothetical protein MOE47_11735 [Bacillus atrophaeus]|nr:hypothetical protein [Bacillus atrophaeus]MCY8912767.1 hypothetical protein [Bacillus atrophaeus]MCY9115084.1 hypothetical protein [Bacillus atrophaeus]MEC0924582.1 hypothetical protein [Bacillus atrophaeus]MEC0933193.1 hypothetical protein [Bacillus atrophaeus]
MKLSRSDKIAGFAELFVKLHVLSSSQKNEIIKLTKQKNR